MKPMCLQLRNFAVTAFSIALAVMIQRPAHAADDGLFKELGGMPGLTRIVDDFSDLYLNDDRIKSDFDGINIPHLKKQLVMQFCMLAGGPCTYKGADMKAVHRGMKINVSQFNALAEDLQIAFDKQNIPYWAQNRFIALLAPMERDIVSQ